MVNSAADELTQRLLPRFGLEPGVYFFGYDDPVGEDADATADQPTMRALWQAVQPKVTSVPCLAIEVNGKVEIVGLPGSPDAAVTLLKKYAEGK